MTWNKLVFLIFIICFKASAQPIQPVTIAWEEGIDKSYTITIMDTDVSGSYEYYVIISTNDGDDSEGSISPDGFTGCHFTQVDNEKLKVIDYDTIHCKDGVIKRILTLECSESKTTFKLTQKCGTDTIFWEDIETDVNDLTKGQPETGFTFSSNPASGHTNINVSYRDRGLYSLVLVTENGEEAWRREWENKEFSPREMDFYINLGDFSQGMYIAVMQTPSGSIEKSLAVIR